jgi:hypothetical protein
MMLLDSTQIKKIAFSKSRGIANKLATRDSHFSRKQLVQLWRVLSFCKIIHSSQKQKLLAVNKYFMRPTCRTSRDPLLPSCNLDEHLTIYIYIYMLIEIIS